MRKLFTKGNDNMKITRKKSKLVSISEIRVGQTFIEDDEIFMMCKYFGDAIECPHCDAEILVDKEIRYPAVMLSNGELFDFEYYAMVEPIECEVVEI